MPTPSIQTIPLGLCQCGCGQQTRIAKETDSRRGTLTGHPVRYIHNHHGVKPRLSFSDAAPFKIDGEYCKLIPLTKGQVTIVWASDYEWLMQWNWYARWSRHTESFYVARNSLKIAGKRCQLQMHRIILGLDTGDPREGDHVNMQTLDNRRRNLRIAANGENPMNVGRRADNSSGFKGVHRHGCGRWAAQIQANGQKRNLGLYGTPEEAYAVYCAAVKKLHGDFGCIA